MLAALTRLTKAEIASLREGPHVPGGTVLHALVYGYAVGASLLFFLMYYFTMGIIVFLWSYIIKLMKSIVQKI